MSCCKEYAFSQYKKGQLLVYAKDLTKPKMSSAILKCTKMQSKNTPLMA
ncbi:hypothetical protein DESAMIL20_874 [Desulfurella amilsii]|uniref:Uncharacterized protein n=1 Tax=Desulfurella amilsii TaxID=1562698 RepID=A0A1X4XUW3_9BACT|nr:hypothetical protein DESAMIL20_874 [Desulfurella amilsii]